MARVTTARLEANVFPAEIELVGDSAQRTAETRGDWTYWTIRPGRPLWGAARLRFRSSAPIVGVDLIGLAGALSLVAVDLAPTDDAAWQTHAAAMLTALHASVESRVVPRRRPSFADEVFSPRALIAGVRRGAELAVLDAVASFVEHALGRWPAPLALAPERAAAASDRVDAWCRAELRNRREHDALTRLFGAAPATAYLDMLFGGARC